MHPLRYEVVVRTDSVSAGLEAKFHQLAAERGFIHVSQQQDEPPHLIVSIGGDGTFLQAFHRYTEQIHHLSFVGVHTGHLGFYADWKPTELEVLVDSIELARQDWAKSVVKYPLVDIRLESEDGHENLLAVNEFTIKSEDGTLVCQININDQRFEMFRGDGICVSTPSGSTGYNKSVGGAVIHPSFEAIQLAGIAALNNRVYRSLGSPIVLPQHHHCDILPRAGQTLIFTVDHLHMHRSNIKAIRCMVAAHKVSFNRFRPFPFWNRVREAFIGQETE